MARPTSRQRRTRKRVIDAIDFERCSSSAHRDVSRPQCGIDRYDVDCCAAAPGIEASRTQIPRLKNGGHTTADLAVSYDIDASPRLFARVDNLLDLRYQDPTGFLQPPLAAYGVQLTY